MNKRIQSLFKGFYVEYISHGEEYHQTYTIYHLRALANNCEAVYKIFDCYRAESNRRFEKKMHDLIEVLDNLPIREVNK